MLERAEELALTGTWCWDLDSDELLWSDNMFRLLGIEPGSVTPSPQYVLQQVHPDDRGRVERCLDSARHEGTLPDPTYRAIWPDGSVHMLRSFPAVPTDADGGSPRRIVGAVQDVTALYELQRRTAESLTLVETLQSAAPVGFAFVDREFRIVRINETLAAVAGMSADQHVGHTVAEVVPDVWQQMEPVYRRVLETGEPAVNVEVVRHMPGEEGFRFWLASCYPVRVLEEVVGLGVVVSDITEREEAEGFRSAVLDTMMEGLFALDDKGRVTMMNAAASRMLGWSPEELHGKPLRAAINFQHADGTPYPEEECPLTRVAAGQPVRMTHEAFTRKDGSVLPVAFSAAPLMNGSAARGVVVVFRDRSDEQAEEERARRELETLAWVGRIRDAIDQDRLVLYAQPIVPLAGGRPAVELLLRIAGADGELIAPGSFLPVAEKYGMIGEIDRWVVRQAVRIAATGERVSANLSAASASDVELLPLIERELRAQSADPANLIFEITETALMHDVEAGTEFARALGRLGCSVALDDFGTGFGSFTYLKTMPVSFLKIDVDFVRDLRTSPANQHVVRAVVGLAEGFGYETIAEGVEDADTKALLAEYGVAYVQGFHLGRPAPLEHDAL